MRLNGERLRPLVLQAPIRKGCLQMLVLSRRLNEKILLPTINAAIQVVEIKRGVVRLGIDAPPEVKILREELHDRAAEWEPSEPAVSDRSTEVKSDKLY